MFIAFRLMLRETETRIIAVAALLTIAIGSLVYMEIEGWSPLDAVYLRRHPGHGRLRRPAPDDAVRAGVHDPLILVGVGILAAFITGLAKNRPLALADRIAERHERASDPPAGTGTGASQ